MKVGVPTEIKADEYRVALTPAGTREFTEHGHEVLVQSGAGDGSVIPDAEYEAQGARVVPDAAACLDDDLVAPSRQLEHAGGGERDAVLVRLDLLRDADPHCGATLLRTLRRAAPRAAVLCRPDHRAGTRNRCPGTISVPAR